MNNDTIECIRFLQERKEEIDIIDKKIDEEMISFEKSIAVKRKEFEETLNSLKKNLLSLSKELDELENSLIQVRLGDLVKELASLKGIDVSNIEIEIEPSVELFETKNINKLIGLFSNKNMEKYWYVLLTDKSQSCPSFSYQLKFKLNEEVYKSYINDYYAMLHIKKNRDDIILDIPLKCLLSDDSIYNKKWYPNDLIVQAISNCYEVSQKDTLKKKKRRNY